MCKKKNNFSSVLNLLNAKKNECFIHFYLQKEINRIFLRFS